MSSKLGQLFGLTGTRVSSTAPALVDAVGLNHGLCY
jgi:hypothetical protein